MPTEDVEYQQRVKIRRSTLGFGVIQVVLGLALTGLSFTAFVLSDSQKIRNACPYWAGFTVLCSGGVGIVAWRYSTVISMSLFTFFSAVCVVLHMIGTILTGEVGGLLKSIIVCHQSVINQSCMCCDSIMTCQQNVPTFKFEGVEECSIITGLVKELMYGLCVLNIFGSLVCFIATILGCTSVARQAGRDQPLFRHRLSGRSDSNEQSQYSWLHYPADVHMLPPYAPPIYRSVDNFQDCGATPYIVPPPVFDPTDLPPPYSSRNISLSSSGFSLDVQCDDHRQQRTNCYERDDGGQGGAAIVTPHTLSPDQYENHYQQRVYSENRCRLGNPAQMTSAVLTPRGVLELCGSSARNHCNPAVSQSSTTSTSSHASLQSETRRTIENIASHFENHILHMCERAEECRESSDSEDKLNSLESKNFSHLKQSREVSHFEENQNCNKRNSFNKNNIMNSETSGSTRTSALIEIGSDLKPDMLEEERSLTSDSGIGDDISPVHLDPNFSTDSQEEPVTNIDSTMNVDMSIGILPLHRLCVRDNFDAHGVLPLHSVDEGKGCNMNAAEHALTVSSDEEDCDRVELYLPFSDNPSKTPAQRADIPENNCCESNNLPAPQYNTFALHSDVRSLNGQELLDNKEHCDHGMELCRASLSGRASSQDCKTDNTEGWLEDESLSSVPLDGACSLSTVAEQGCLDEGQRYRSQCCAQSMDALTCRPGVVMAKDGTDEVIRMMDDFMSSEHVNRKLDVGLPVVCTNSAVLRTSAASYKEVVPMDADCLRCGGCEERCDKVSHGMVWASGTLSDGGSLDDRRASINKTINDRARSDTCIILHQNTHSSTGLGSGVHVVRRRGSPRAATRCPATQRAGFLCSDRLTPPPNIELPMEIRDECLPYYLNKPSESKRRRNQTGKDVPRPKRRAVGKDDSVITRKSRSNLLSARNRVDHTEHRATKRTERPRSRDDLSRSSYYKDRRLPRDECLWSPTFDKAWNPFKRGRSIQHLPGNGKSVGLISGVSLAGCSKRKALARPKEGTTGEETIV